MTNAEWKEHLNGQRAILGSLRFELDRPDVTIRWLRVWAGLREAEIAERLTALAEAGMEKMGFDRVAATLQTHPVVDCRPGPAAGSGPPE